MSHFIVEIWVGRGEQRWQTELVEVYADSREEAVRIVADARHLPPGSWGDEHHPFHLTTAEPAGTTEHPQLAMSPKAIAQLPRAFAYPGQPTLVLGEAAR